MSYPFVAPSPMFTNHTILVAYLMQLPPYNQRPQIKSTDYLIKQVSNKDYASFSNNLYLSVNCVTIPLESYSNDDFAGSNCIIQDTLKLNYQQSLVKPDSNNRTLGYFTDTQFDNTYSIQNPVAVPLSDYVNSIISAYGQIKDQGPSIESINVFNIYQPFNWQATYDILYIGTGSPISLTADITLVKTSPTMLTICGTNIM